MEELNNNPERTVLAADSLTEKKSTSTS